MRLERVHTFDLTKTGWGSSWIQHGEFSPIPSDLRGCHLGIRPKFITRNEIQISKDDRLCTVSPLMIQLCRFSSPEPAYDSSGGGKNWLCYISKKYIVMLFNSSISRSADLWRNLYNQSFSGFVARNISDSILCGQKILTVADRQALQEHVNHTTNFGNSGVNVILAKMADNNSACHGRLLAQTMDVYSSDKGMQNTICSTGTTIFKGGGPHTCDDLN